MPILALSVGNSNLSAGLVEDGRVREARSVPVGDGRRWGPLLRWIEAEGRACPVVAASVNPVKLVALEARLHLPVSVLGRDRPLPVENRTLKPEQTGHDRLLGALAGSRLYGTPLLAVDFGTAYTFNRVDEDGAFLGGAILPGLDLASGSLARGCARLPRVRTDSRSVPVLGRDTVSAVRSGLLHGYAGMVRELVRRFLDEAPPGMKVVVTGGDAPRFLPCFPSPPAHDPHLVLKGIALAVEGGAGPRDRRGGVDHGT